MGLLLNRLSQLSTAVIVDLATALLLFGVVALFYGSKPMKWSSMLKVSAISLSVFTTVSVKAELGEPEIED
ncbi:nitrate ABC transporter, nitrate-binding protein [Vibrio sp. JCM 18904]|nr:nitrate ABC transporter, nitrate-binding protein [Vibrio sp. JCM 18904]